MVWLAGLIPNYDLRIARDDFTTTATILKSTPFKKTLSHASMLVLPTCKNILQVMMHVCCIHSKFLG